METIEKVNVDQLRKEIKKLVEKQKWLKNQRKTVNKDCSRKEGDPEDIEPWEATMKHYHNRKELSVMYSVLLVLRGWSEDDAADAHLSKKDESWTFDSMKDKMKKVLESYND